MFEHRQKRQVRRHLRWDVRILRRTARRIVRRPDRERSDPGGQSVDVDGSGGIHGENWPAGSEWAFVGVLEVRHAVGDLGGGQVLIEVARVPAAGGEASGRDGHRAVTEHLDEETAEGGQSCGRGVVMPPVYENGPPGVAGDGQQHCITGPAERVSLLGCPPAERVEQRFQDHVLVEKGQRQSVCYPARERGLPATG